MSRKLIYAAGLLASFSLALDAEVAERLKRAEPQSSGKSGVEKRVEHFKRLLEKPPLEILAAHLINHQHLHDAAKRIFNAYDRFLGALANETDRKVLEDMSEEDRGESDLYRAVQQATHEFRDALLEVFFDDQSGLGNLTKSYGVF